jgi:hypothetical protein
MDEQPSCPSAGCSGAAAETRVAHQRRAGPCRGPAAELHGVSPLAVQRPGRARRAGQLARAQPVHGRHHRGPGDAVDDPHPGGSLSGHHRNADHRHPHRRQHSRDRGCRRGPVGRARDGADRGIARRRRADRAAGAPPQHLADAAARRELPPARLATISRIWLIVLRGYLVVAAGLVLARIVQLATVGA